MIVPMKRVFLVVMDKYREASLTKLRDIGVVHLEKKNVTSDALASLQTKKSALETAIMLLNSYEAKAKLRMKAAGGASAKPETSGEEAKTGAVKRASDFVNPNGVPYDVGAVDAHAREQGLFRHILNLEDERKSLQERSTNLSREQSRIKEWGDFDPQQVRHLSENGIPLYLYEFTEKTFNSLPKDVPYIVIKKTKAIIYITSVGVEIAGETPVELGKYSLSALESLQTEVQEKLNDIENHFIALTERAPDLQSDLETLVEQIEFQTASEGMQTLEDSSNESTVSWLSGYVPGEKVPLLKSTAASNGWALMLDDPAPADLPPTQLKNGPVARIIQPLFSFLGTVPGYREFDISPSYLLFFSIFFAMILGDAAYGLIILSIGLLVGFSAKKKSGVFPDIAKLLVFLSCFTIVWGTLIGSWFMIPHANLPPVLLALVLPPFNNTGPLMEFPSFLQNVFGLPAEVPMDEFKTRWSIQFLCFTIAVVQLTWARGKRFMRQLPSLSAVAQIGWLLLMVGFYFLVLFMLLGVQFPAFAPYLLGTGVALILLFSEQKGGNFLVNVGKGLAGLFPTFLKTVSCFADVISYIRLFAVGMAGAMIGLTFNQMAFPEDGLGMGIAFVVRFVVAVVLVVFGHALNLALASLSVIVHGVRLNLLEYAGNHLEMEWSGYAYNPFALKQKNKQ